MHYDLMAPMRTFSVTNFEVNGHLIGTINPPMFQLPYLDTLKISGAQITMHTDALMNMTSPLTYLELTGSTVEGPLSAICNQNQSQLDLTTLILTATSVTGTIPECLGDLVPTLRHLDLSRSTVYGPLGPWIGKLESLNVLLLESLPAMGQIPEEIGKTKLHMLDLRNSAVTGTIPFGLVSQPHLYFLDLSYNQITGTIPRFVTDFGRGLPRPPKQAAFDMSFNDMSGTLDAFAASNLSSILPISITIDNNQLVGSIPVRLFSIRSLSLASNYLSGNLTLPSSPGSSLTILNLTKNQLSGELPDSYLMLHIMQLQLSHNRFNGTIPGAYANFYILNMLDISFNELIEGPIPRFSHPYLTAIHIDNTSISGTIPGSLKACLALQNFTANHAKLNGSLPFFPFSLSRIQLAGNQLEGTLDEFGRLLPHFLTHLDLSNNRFSGTIPTNLLNLRSLEDVRLDHNDLEGPIPPSITSSIQYLDLSHSRLNGSIPPTFLIDIEYLDLSSNKLEGDILFRAPSLTQLDISKNRLHFNAQKFELFPNLQILDASDNLIFGSLPYLSKYLQLIQLSDNCLNTSIDFFLLNGLSRNNPGRVFELSIQNNPIPIVNDISKVPLARLPYFQSSGSVNRQYSCQLLGFSGFKYGDELFAFQQCECLSEHFGKPPLCYRCDNSINCADPKTGMTINKGEFYFPSPFFFQGSLPAHLTSTAESNSLIPIYKESCAYWEAGGSNCIGTIIPPTRFSENSSISSMIDVLSTQCRPGSSGRLCSRCECDEVYGEHGECYFTSSGYCLKCKHVWSPRNSILFFVSIVVIGLLIISTLMSLVLNSRRKIPLKPWSDIGKFKQFLGRGSLLIELGFVPIVVNFIQISAELTRWDILASKSIASVFNGDFSGFGIICLFPFLSNPRSMLIVQLLIPIVVALIFTISIGIAHVLHKIIKSRRSVLLDHDDGYSTMILDSEPDEHERLIESGSGIEDFDSQQSSMKLNGLNSQRTDHDEHSTKLHILNGGQDLVSDYPTRALLSSTMISISTFFYFSTALNATKYFFHFDQPHTTHQYVLSVPWMRFDDASSLRSISIPIIVLFVGGLPVCYLCILLAVRKKISSSTTSLYFGSIIDRFKQKIFWWELVNIGKKLLVALFLRSFTIADAWQTGSIVIVLSITLIAQIALRPWKRDPENLLDSLSGVLLIINVLVNPIANMLHSYQLTFVVLALDAMFILLVVSLIIFHALTGTTEYEKRQNPLYHVSSILKASSSTISSSNKTVDSGKESYKALHSETEENLDGIGI
jgi:hypothetical protein